MKIFALTALLAALDSSLLPLDVMLDCVGHSCRKQLSLIPLLAIAELADREV